MTFDLQRLFVRRHTAVGARPGTLSLPESKAAARLLAVRYDAERLERLTEVEPSALASLLAPHQVLWLEVRGLGDEALLRQLGEQFGLHTLLLEDIVNAPQRPKTESYAAHHFFVTRHVEEQDGELRQEQVSIVLGDGYVLSFLEQDTPIFEPVRRRLRQGTPIRGYGADYLAYALLDTLVDHYQPLIERLGERLDALEDVIIADSDPEVSRRLSELRTQLLELRRVFSAQRDALARLGREGSPLISRSVTEYLRDPLDHCIQASEAADVYREILGGLMNTYLSVVSNRTNEVMRVLTIMSSIFIPLSFLAGVYGMNFDQLPGLHRGAAYEWLFGAMLFIAAAMLGYFYRRGWLGRKPP